MAESVSPGGYIDLNAELRVAEVSSGARALYGWDGADLIGRPIAELLHTSRGPIDWSAALAMVRAGKTWRELALHRSSAGLEKWVDLQIDARGAGVSLLARRASGRAVVERAPNALFTALGRGLEIGGVGTWIDDGITDQLEWSPLSRTLYGIAPGAELTHAAFFAQIHPDDQPRVAAEIQSSIVRRAPFDLTFRVRNGEVYRDLHVFGVVIDDGGGTTLLGVGGMRDVTEQVALRKRIQELENQLNAAQRGDVVGRLAGGIAHDFNNILTGILGCCEMLSSAQLTSIEMGDLEQIRIATLRAADLTRQLLAFGRRQALRPRSLSPHVIVQDVVRLLRRTIPENIELLEQTADFSGSVLADVTQMHQVLTNLVVNAAQAMPDGGAVKIGCSRVRRANDVASTAEPADYVCFRVEDNGPGVPEELRHRIFEPFFTTKGPGQGSGLGLSVVQGIVDQHRGHIRVGSSKTGGACFEIFLPVDDATSITSDSSAPPPPPPTSVLTVLVVEDEKMVRELTKRILQGAGMRVLEASDAEEALQYISDDIDILLTDVVLPSMSGPELVARCRERAHQFRVVYMSGYPADFVESRVTLRARDVLVQKPFTAGGLLRALQAEALERT